MAKKNFYAVILTDGRKEILRNWDDAKALIATCPKNAIYKGFPGLGEAEGFLASNGQAAPEQPDLPVCDAPGKIAVAYVDGSFNQTAGAWGAGVLFADAADPSKTTPLSKSGTAYAEHRNVTGEVYAAMMAVQYAQKLKYETVIIYHDYSGISAWVDGSWKATEKMTQIYAEWMGKHKDGIKIEFRKVKGHSGVAGNESVDKIAKAACGVI